jgi:hypothetical protein
VSEGRLPQPDNVMGVYKQMVMRNRDGTWRLVLYSTDSYGRVWHSTVAVDEPPEISPGERLLPGETWDGGARYRERRARG